MFLYPSFVNYTPTCHIAETVCFYIYIYRLVRQLKVVSLFVNVDVVSG